MSSRALKLFRVLVPSWGFFADVADLPVLFVRTADSSGSWGEWFPAVMKPQRRLWSVLFNPEGNLYLAYNTLLQQVESDIGELDGVAVQSFESSVSFRLLHNLVRYRLNSAHDEHLRNVTQYQFRLERRPQGDPKSSTGEAFLTSKIYPA